MSAIQTQDCECADLEHLCADPERAYYVTIIDADRYSLALGPFETHRQALAKVESVNDWVREQGYAGAPWWGFGTSSIDRADARPGKLNHILQPA